MTNLGILFALIGGAILAYTGLVGFESGIDGFRVTNFAGLFVGSSLFVGGCVLWAAGGIAETMQKLHRLPRPVAISENESRASRQPQERAQRNKNPTVTATTSGEQTFVETYKGIPIYKRHNGHYIGEKWFAGIQQARAYLDSEQDAQRAAGFAVFRTFGSEALAFFYSMIGAPPASIPRAM